jgi:hypothetical protein
MKITPAGIRLLQEFHLLGKLWKKFISGELDTGEAEKTWTGIYAEYLEMFPRGKAVDFEYLLNETGDEPQKLRPILSRLLKRGYITGVK